MRAHHLALIILLLRARRTPCVQLTTAPGSRHPTPPSSGSGALEQQRATPADPRADALLLDAPQPFKIAAASIRSIRGQTAANIATHIKFAERAAKQGAQLVLFPEGSIHSLWCTFDVGATTTELAVIPSPRAHLFSPRSCLPQMLAAQANSEPIPGPTTELLQGHCKRLGIAVAVGMNHLGMARMPNGKALNAYVVIDGSGVVHVQHKAQ